VDLETGAVVAVTVQDADEGDTATSIEMLIEAAEQIETDVPGSATLEEVVALWWLIRGPESVLKTIWTFCRRSTPRADRCACREWRPITLDGATPFATRCSTRSGWAGVQSTSCP
jgi:hypothetical protein